MNESESTARRRELGASLRRLREGCGFNGLDMAARMHWPPSALSRLELGKRSATAIEIIKYTTLCGIVGGTQDALVDLGNEPDDYRLVRHEGKIPDQLDSLIFHESKARTIESLQLFFVPSMLQTKDYARALFGMDPLPPAVIDQLVQARMRRSAILARADPPRCVWYIHENAVRLPVGHPQVMHEQMLHLVLASTRSHCDIRVVPASAGMSGLARGSFDIFGYPDDAPLVYLSHLATSEFLESPESIRVYREIVDRVAAVALPGLESRSFLVQLAAQYELQMTRPDEPDAS